MRIERVVLETEHHQIVGDIHLPTEGYRSRLSDYLNRSDNRFVALSHVEVRPVDGSGNGHAHERDFLAVSRDHVTLAYPYSTES